MRSVFAATVIAVSLSSGSAFAQDEISLGWYADNWEATTFPSGDGGWNCSVDSRADNLPDSAGAWTFVFPSYLQFAPNEGLPADGIGVVSVDNSVQFEMSVVGGQVGFVADADDLPLLQAIAQGQTMTIEVWPASNPNNVTDYVYSLDGFRDAYQRISEECRFDPSPVLGAAPSTRVTPAEPAMPEDSVEEEESGGSSLFQRERK